MCLWCRETPRLDMVMEPYFVSLLSIHFDRRPRLDSWQAHQMYQLAKTTHDQDGSPLELLSIVETEDLSAEVSPFAILRIAFLQQKRMPDGKAKHLLVIDGCLLNSKQAESWAQNEYEDLPKCSRCGSILRELYCVHNLSEHRAFCSDDCKGQDYLEEVEKLNDEYDCDFD